MSYRLPKDFFQRPTLAVARELLGKTMVFKNFEGIITETEAYIGENDPACHAAKGKTKRTEVMFGPAGFTYVYCIYGMYHCLNFVTEKEGFPAAVLIRSIELKNKQKKLLNGPGKLCKHLGITKEHNKIDLTTSDIFYLRDSGIIPKNIQKTPRIGIRVGTEKLWRFFCTS